MQAKLLELEGRAGTWSTWVEKRIRHSKEFPEFLFRIVPYIMHAWPAVWGIVILFCFV